MTKLTHEQIDAMEAGREMVKLGSGIELSYVSQIVEYFVYFVPRYGHNNSGGDTASLAICRAALKAVTK